jgi:hypothetical protein
MIRRLLVPGLLLAAGAGPARAQTMLDQERRLIEIHSLLVALPPVDAPGARGPGEASLGLEVVTIPTIDGTTGGKRQITASDRTRAFPRPRLAVGLPAPAGFRAFAGLAYVPPLELRGVSSHLGALEAGLAWLPVPGVALGLRGHLAYAESRSPVTDPATRDTLRTLVAGADLAAGWRIEHALGSATPYAGVGLARVAGDFRVTSDGVVLRSRTTDLALHAGVRLLARQRLELAAELEAVPGRLVHPAFRIAWAPEWGVGS